MDIYHGYHVAPQLFPTKEEIGIARQTGKHRLLMENWKPEDGHTWAQVAKGSSDAQIDREAAYLKATYTAKFFLAVHHEPENEINATAGSGFTATDYRAMFRHVVLRLRNDGVRNAVTVMDYMGDPTWGAKPWFRDLYPGDDVVDWVAADPYACVRVDNCGDFAGLVNRRYGSSSSWPGFYKWSTTNHASKPIMIAEWGVFEHTSDPSKKAAFFRSVMSELGNFPKIKALVYFDSPHASRGDTRVTSSPVSLAAFRQLVDLPALLKVHLP
jgi:beta-mannanase